MFGCGKKEPKVISVVDKENMKMLVFTGERTQYVKNYDADFVIIGGGLGGIAATIALCSSGRSVILIEETDKIAGCFASQDTSQYFDSRFMEKTGSSIRYQNFRSKIRKWYDERARQQPRISSPFLTGIEDFGKDNFCFESQAAIDVIYEMLENYIDREHLTILRRNKVAEVLYFGEKISSLNVVDLDNKVVNQVTGWMFIDATETGYILPLAGIEYVIGRESKTDTGEPNAPDNADSLESFEYYYYSDADTGDDEDYYEINLTREKPDNADSTRKIAFVKEPRRIKAFTRIAEQDISAEYNPGPRARFFRDSVGIGYNFIDIPRSEDKKKDFIIRTKPFQIPFSALIIPKFSNFISAGKTMGTTYIASRAYGAPSVEWAIGEGAGELSAFCAGHNISTHELMNSEEYRASFREWMVKTYGIPIYWYEDVAPVDSDFTKAQMKPFDDPDYHKFSRPLRFKE